MISSYFSRLKFQQKVSLSFAVMLLFVVANVVVATIAVVSITSQMETLSKVEQIIGIINQISASESSFAHTLSREDANHVYLLIDSIQLQLSDIRTRFGSEKNIANIESLMGDFRGNFQKYVIEEDQTMALESRATKLGKNLVENFDTIRSRDVGLFRSGELNYIASQVLDLQWQGRELKAGRIIQSPEKLRSIEGRLAKYSDQARFKPRDRASQIVFFEIVRDTRDYVSAYEHHISNQILTAKTEKELRAISERANQACLAFHTSVRQQIHHRIISTGVLLLVLFLVLIALTQYIASALSHQIISPVSKLVSITKKITEGNLDARAEVTVNDEIGELAHSFNVMADKLQRSKEDLAAHNRNLEQRVVERTNELKLSRDSISNLNELFKQFMMFSPVYAVINEVTYTESTILMASDNYQQMIGIPGQEMVGRTITELFPFELAAKINAENWSVVSDGQVLTSEDFFEGRFYHNIKFPITQGEKTLLAGYTIDITEQKRAEEEKLELERQVHHSQKLESLGIMAGGIAHDFNNLLQAIMGNMELAMMKLPLGSQPLENIAKAMIAIRRAAHLTNMMLNYAGSGFSIKKTLNLNELIRENTDMLRTAAQKSVSFELCLPIDLPQIMGDDTQIQQVVMNLITNAAESIEDRHGIVKITTGSRICDQVFLAASLLEVKPEPGYFVLLEVCDNGCGMTGETIKRLFDPFFTTKFAGRGLGMSAVMGILRTHGAAIFVESRPGEGTTFTVLFPALEAAASAAAQKLTSSTVDKSALKESPLTGVALVVDDEKTVLRTCSKMVMLCGFSVITACDGIDAVAKFREHSNEITVVLMDLTMPNMDGLAAMGEIYGMRADAVVILTSGFSEEELGKRITSHAPAGFIRKPYSMGTLEAEMKRVCSPCVSALKTNSPSASNLTSST